MVAEILIRLQDISYSMDHDNESCLFCDRLEAEKRGLNLRLIWKKAIKSTLKNWVAYQIMHALVIMHDQDIEETAGLLFRNTTEEEGRRGVFILLREIFCPQDIIPSSMIFHETLRSLWVVCTQSISKILHLFFLLMR